MLGKIICRLYFKSRVPIESRKNMVFQILVKTAGKDIYLITQNDKITVQMGVNILHLNEL